MKDIDLLGILVIGLISINEIYFIFIGFGLGIFICILCAWFFAFGYYFRVWENKEVKE